MSATQHGRKALWSSYMRDVLTPSVLKRNVERVSQVLIALRAACPAAVDAIAARGMSGAAIAFPVSMCTGLPVAIVRSPSATTHSDRTVEGVTNVARYVILDDFIETGATIDAIRAAMAPAVCVGIACYKHGYNAANFVSASIDVPMLLDDAHDAGPCAFTFTDAQKWITAVAKQCAGGALP